MPIDHERLMEILADALEAPPSDRNALIERACGDDEALRLEVDRLLNRQKDADAALGHPAGAFAWAGDSLANGSTTGGVSNASSGQSETLVGATIGPYVLLEVAGRGGMGVVYRARDSRLNRPVAIKSLPPGLNDEPARLARFAREARLLSQLSNPFVATVYGLEENAKGRFLVMEWVEGQTLSARLSRGPLPVEEVVRVCSQIAAGLAAAHDLGVIHRDVKPSNVMLTASGQVKLLDFGLARRTVDDVPRPGTDDASMLQASMVDSVDLSITAGHLIVGTPRYMSPEQLRGEAIDRRTDVFSFGCVLYECLAGKPAFEGTTAVAIAVNVIERDPDFSVLPGRMPPGLSKLLARCLAKDPARRLRDLNDARLELEELAIGRDWPSAVLTARPKRRRLLPIALATAAIAAAFATGWILRQFAGNASTANGNADVPPPGQTPPSLATVGRFNVSFPKNLPQAELARLGVAVSPDGEHILVSATDGQQRQIWWRRRGEDEFRPIEGTSRAWLPSFSADGQWITYIIDGGLYKRRLLGGASHRIARVVGYWGTSSYGYDDITTFVPFWGKGIARVSTGGTPRFITTVDPRQNEFSHVAPSVTPDNKAVVFTVWDGKNGLKVDVCKLDGTGRKNILRRGAGARVVRTPSGGAIIYERDGLLFGARFDLDKLEPISNEVRIAEGIAFDQSLFRPIYAASDEGTLVYVPGTRFTEESRLSWQRTISVTEPISDVRAAFIEPQVTSDRTLISGMLKGEIYRPFLYRLADHRLEPIDIEGDVSSAVISPDGKTLIYTSNRDGPYGIWKRDLTTLRETQVMRGEADVPRHLNWAPDNRSVVFDMSPTIEEYREIYRLDVESGALSRLTQSAGDERAPRISPSGRWLAYSTDETGRHEVYLRSFPDGKEAIRLTQDGGDWPVWSPSDRILYFRNNGKLWLLQIDTETGLPQRAAGAPPRPMLVLNRDFGQSDLDSADYTVMSDGRLLLIEPSEREAKVEQIRVILNWHRLLPPKADSNR